MEASIVDAIRDLKEALLGKLDGIALSGKPSWPAEDDLTIKIWVAKRPHMGGQKATHGYFWVAILMNWSALYYNNLKSLLLKITIKSVSHKLLQYTDVFPPDVSVGQSIHVTVFNSLSINPPLLVR